MMPSLISYEFVTGIDSNYRCEVSNICNMLSVINKIIFLMFIIRSSIQLRQIETRQHKSNLIAFVVIIFIYIPSNLFVICNENWLDVLSFDDARKVGFISSVFFTVFVICNHIMMQAQAKKHVVSGMRRVSNLVVRASIAARRSIMLSIGGGNNKICMDPSAQQNRFSIPEITEDEYDSIHIKQDNDKQENVLSAPEDSKAANLKNMEDNVEEREHNDENEDEQAKEKIEEINQEVIDEDNT